MPSRGQNGGAMIWVDHATGRYRLALGASRFAGMVNEPDAQVQSLDEVIEKAHDGVHVLSTIFVAGQKTSQPHDVDSSGRT